MVKENRVVATWVLVLLGILSLAPILGGIIGLGSLILGLTIYKNRMLIIIGIIGIIMTTIAMVYLNYYSTHRGPFDDGRIMVAQKRMEGLIKDIELYKVNIGQYPLDLVSLKKIDPELNINDPIQAVHPEEADQHFFYRLADQKYYLFSKGFDGISFTKDDILPSLNGINPNKIGIIISSSTHDNGIQ